MASRGKVDTCLVCLNTKLGQLLALPHIFSQLYKTISSRLSYYRFPSKPECLNQSAMTLFPSQSVAKNSPETFISLRPAPG